MSGHPLAEALLRASRSDPANPRSEAAVRELAGVALDALRAGQVIIPGAAGRPASVPAMGRKWVMWAFTDEEAYLAWASHQPAEAMAAWAPATVGGGRKEISRVLDLCRADMMVINPCGPGGVVWPTDYVRSRAGGPSIRKASLQPIDATLADPAARASARAAIAEAVNAGGAALAAGDQQQVDAAVRAGRPPSNELGDLYASAALDELLVRARLAGDPVGSGLTRAVLNSANNWSQLGQAREAAALLVVGGQRAVAALESGDPDPWLRQALGLVAAQLAVLDLPERRSDADTALAWARHYPAGAQ